MEEKRTAEAVDRADREPTLAGANEDLRKIVAAGLLMQEWGVDTIEGAASLAGTRVRGARRRQGYDHQD